MKAIYKYDIPDEREFAIPMPSGAEILHIDRQMIPSTQEHINWKFWPAGFRIWAMVTVDEGVMIDTRRFRTIDTGEHFDLPAGKRRHLGTFLIGPLVNHLYEIL